MSVERVYLIWEEITERSCAQWPALAMQSREPTSATVDQIASLHDGLSRVLALMEQRLASEARQAKNQVNQELVLRQVLVSTSNRVLTACRTAFSGSRRSVSNQLQVHYLPTIRAEAEGLNGLLEAEPVVTYNGLVRLSRRFPELCEQMQPLVRAEWQLRQSEFQLLVQLAEVIRSPRHPGNLASNISQFLDLVGLLLGKPSGTEGNKKMTDVWTERIFQNMLGRTLHFGGSDQCLVAFAVICGPVGELLDAATINVPLGPLFDSYLGKLNRDIRKAQAEIDSDNI